MLRHTFSLREMDANNIPAIDREWEEFQRDPDMRVWVEFFNHIVNYESHCQEQLAERDNP